jgi:hypothetical protein
MMESQRASQRCIASGKAHGVLVIGTWSAVTPGDDCWAFSNLLGDGFEDNPYSRRDPCVATFMSHYSLWAHCVATDKPILILEHDAIFKAPLPDLSDFEGLVNLGRPSFGKFKTPKDGFGPLTSKPYLPGAHAYYVTPGAAAELLEKAKTEACPTDVFLSLDRFPWLTEYFPWPIVCEDTFTTIQKAAGCKAKHRRVEII